MYYTTDLHGGFLSVYPQDSQDQPGSELEASPGAEDDFTVALGQCHTYSYCDSLTKK